MADLEAVKDSLSTRLFMRARHVISEIVSCRCCCGSVLLLLLIFSKKKKKKRRRNSHSLFTQIFIFPFLKGKNPRRRGCIQGQGLQEVWQADDRQPQLAQVCISTTELSL